MFKEMRKKEKELSDKDIVEILNKGEFGTLATIGENGFPYAVPLNYVYYDNSIYFHCALEGHKLENIRNNNKVSFSIVLETKLYPSKFSTKFKSAIIFGISSEVEDYSKEIILLEFVKKYSSDFIEEGKEYIKMAKDKTKIVKISIEHITGKGRIS